MRRLTLYFLALMIGAVTCQSLFAQQDSAAVHHRLGFSLQGGTAFLFFSAKDASIDWGYGGGLSVVYELNYRHFLFRTGAGADITFNYNRLAPQSATRAVLEYPGMEYHFTFEPWREQQRYATAYVPLYFGGVWSGFHFLLGTKIGFQPFLGQSRITTSYTLYGTDPDVVNPMYDLYTHKMTPQTLTATQNLTFNRFNIMASAELGLCFDPWMKPESKAHVYLSLFADYGVLSINDAAANHIQDELINIRSLDDLRPASMLGHTDWQNERLNNLFAGLKLTCLFELPSKHKKPQTDPPTELPADEPILRTESETAVTPCSDTVINYVPVPILLPIPLPTPVPVREEAPVTISSPTSLNEWKEVTNTAGRTFVLDNLYFATAKHTILSSSEPALQVLLEMMLYYPDRRIRITGHTDNVGKDEDNWKLSLRRAVSVKRWLYEHGIDPYRIETEGRGETCPRVPNNSPENRQLNRRVEITIL